jgi:hypothetical protein
MPNWGATGPQFLFPKTGNEMRSQNSKNIAQWKPKKNTKLIFSPAQIGPRRVSPPVLDLRYRGFHCWIISFVESSLVRIGLCKSSELIPSFMKRYPIFLTVTDTIKLRMKQGLEDQTSAHRQGEFTNHSNGQNLKKCGWNVIKFFSKKKISSKIREHLHNNKNPS